MPPNRLDSIAARETERTLARLPEPIRVAAADCTIECVMMADCLARGESIEPDLLGLFEGCSRADPLPEGPEHLPRIRLFLDNLWEYAQADPKHFRDEVRITLLHELGHYLGFDEAAVEELGLA